MNKLKVLISIVIVIIVIFASFFIINKNEKIKDVGITALEAKIVADEIAHDWSQNATLICLYAPILPVDKMIDNGTYLRWNFIYLFAEGSPDYKTQSLLITIYSDGRSESVMDMERYCWPVISDFQIDSDQAYQIAMSNNTIINFLKNETQGPSYQMHNVTGNLSWDLEWGYVLPGAPDKLFRMLVSIDARTGEIISVNIFREW